MKMYINPRVNNEKLNFYFPRKFGRRVMKYEPEYKKRGSICGDKTFWCVGKSQKIFYWYCDGWHIDD